MRNEGFWGLPTKNGIILVVTVTGWGVDERYLSFSIACLFSSVKMDFLVGG